MNFPDEIPEEISSIFETKAITYLSGSFWLFELTEPDYVPEVLGQLVKQLDQIKSKRTDKKFVAPSTEQLNNRVFISHRRLTGQTIAGRIYEHLKKNYKCFLGTNP